MAASFPHTLIPLVCSITLLLALATTPGDATSFSYNFNQKPDPLNSMSLQGDAHYLKDTDEIGLIRLTKTDESGKALNYSAGRAVYLVPFKFWGDGMQVDFETTMKFIINPNSGDTDPADGFTFFIEPVDAPMGANGASFGEFNYFGSKRSTFAIEFDIHQDRNDPSYPHVGIDIETIDSVVTMEVGNELIGQVVTARIDYKAATSVISVKVTIGSKTYEVSYVKDLSTVLPQEVQFGFSAATGDRVAVHDLISWEFSTTPNTVNGSSGIRQVV
ncbi:lectin alpha chain-like [Salvia miltiorrhiza]|uniref:lectin alpha chain-like n=1 Tax=Salvia miltiorrhiza TaxID=226208 RepID=UPI0025ACD8D5|nr:lectin alpha chain-like [Salvia miltiorrhiza]